MGSLDLYRAHPHLSATLQPASSLGTNLTRGDSRLSLERPLARTKAVRGAVRRGLFARTSAFHSPRREIIVELCVLHWNGCTRTHAHTRTRLRSHTRNSRRAGHTDSDRRWCLWTRLARHRVVHFCTTRVTIAIIASHSISTASENMWQAAPLCTMHCCVTRTYPLEDRAAICATFPILLHCATSRRTLHVDAPPVVLSERQTNVASQRHALLPHDHVTGQ